MNNKKLVESTISDFRIKHYDEWMNNYTKKDQELFRMMIDEINHLGYDVHYYFEIEDLLELDRRIGSVILRFIGKFDNPGATETLMRYLGHNGFYEATPFILYEFRRDDVIIPESRKKWEKQDKKNYRESASVALREIKDPRYVDDYIELINNPSTHNDCFNIIQLLGILKIKSELQLLFSLLDDKNPYIQCASIIALSYFKNNKDACFHIRSFLLSDNKMLRQHAKRALSKLGCVEKRKAPL